MAGMSQVVADLTHLATKTDESEVLPRKQTKNKTLIIKNTEKSDENVIRGIPKSGKFWKGKREKFSNINKTKGLRQSFKKKSALREDLQRVKELSKKALEELKQKQLQRKERRRENIKRTEEKQRKAEIVQVITNTSKLKRMRKKQLRFIQKRDTNEAIEKNK